MLGCDEVRFVLILLVEEEGRRRKLYLTLLAFLSLLVPFSRLASPRLLSAGCEDVV